jgi:hypothetical protein
MAAIDVPHTLNIILHTGTGSLALACGLGALLSRKVSPRHRQWGRGFVRLGWPVMLTATCFAMAAAFAGNVLDAWQPWSQVLPSALGMVALLWLAWRYGWQRSALETGSASR